MARRVRWKSHARCRAGEKLEIVTYLVMCQILTYRYLLMDYLIMELSSLIFIQLIHYLIFLKRWTSWNPLK